LKSVKEWKAINREYFEKEYKSWILSVSKDISYKLGLMDPEKRKSLIESYKQLENPLSVFNDASERLNELAGEKLRTFILVETDAVSFFPSLYSPSPIILDYAVAMNRRFYCKGLWFSIISLNSQFIEQTTNRMLSFALEHEFQMNNLYDEATTNLRSLSPEEKRQIYETAYRGAVEKLSITPEEVAEEEMLMLKLTNTQPLIPKPYAEMALLCYLEDGFDTLEKFGHPSNSAKEDKFGRELYGEFSGWADFSHRTYHLFVREIVNNLEESYRGYV
jgi:hypothetical protein